MKVTHTHTCPFPPADLYVTLPHFAWTCSKGCCFLLKLVSQLVCLSTSSLHGFSQRLLSTCPLTVSLNSSRAGQEVWSDEGRAEATALWASVVAVMKMPMDLNSFGSRATALESEDYPEAVLEVIWSKLGQIQSTLSGQKKEWVPPLAVQDLGPALIDGADGDEGALEGAKEPAAASKEGLKGLKLPKQPMGVRGGRGTRGADAPGQGPQSSSGDEASSILADVAGVGAGFVSGMGAMGIASFGYHKLAGGGRMALQRSSIGARAGAAPRANAGAMSC